MVEDASQGIAFVCNNIASYGGDPERFITYNDIKLSNFSVAITKWFLPTYALLMRWCAQIVTVLIIRIPSVECELDCVRDIFHFGYLYILGF